MLLILLLLFSFITYRVSDEDVHYAILREKKLPKLLVRHNNCYREIGHDYPDFQKLKQQK